MVSMTTLLFAATLLGSTFALMDVDAVNFDIPIDITHSDDGRSVELPYFLLQVYETDGDLTDESIVRLQDALDAYLLAELNAIFSPLNVIDFVNSTMLSQASVEMDPSMQRLLLPSSRQQGPTKREKLEWEMRRGSMDTEEDERRFLKGKRKLQSVVGSQVDVFVNVTFDRVPMPTLDVVNQELKNVMVDLNNLVNNITASTDSEFQAVFLALRLEPPTPAPSSAPSETPSTSPSGMPTDSPSASPSTTPSVLPSVPPSFSPTAKTTIPPTVTTSDTPSSSPTQPVAGVGGVPGAENPELPPSLGRRPQGRSNMIIISSVLVAAVIVIAGVFLVWKRRNREDDDDEHGDREGLFEIESDLESSMGGAPSTPGGQSYSRSLSGFGAGSRSNRPSPMADEHSYAAGDSVFSGLTDILHDTGSPRLRAVKSMSSVTTIKANNYERHTPLSGSGTNSLFTFEEGDEDDDGDVDSQTHNSRSVGQDQSTTISTGTVGGSPVSISQQAPPASRRSSLRSSTRTAGSGQGTDDPDTTPLRQNTASTNRNGFGADPLASKHVQQQQPQQQSWQARVSRVGTNVMSAMTAGATPWKASSDDSAPNDGAATTKNTTASNRPAGSSTDGSFPSLDLELDHSVGRRRHHAGYSGKEDGSSAYQTAMYPLDRSFVSEGKKEVDSTVSSGVAPKQTTPQQQRTPKSSTAGVNVAVASTNSSGNASASAATNQRFVFDSDVVQLDQQGRAPLSPLYTPKSNGVSTNSGQSSAGTYSTNSSQMSASRQLINDLVWLERKIAGVKSNNNGNNGTTGTTTPDSNNNGNSNNSRSSNASRESPLRTPDKSASAGVIDGLDDQEIGPSDSLSYVSNDAMVSPSSKGSSRAEDNDRNGGGGDGGDDDSVVIDDSQEHIMQSIVCRDCFAPPGKLQIVIHSTKDGPAVHTVKPGSSLEGHIFPGDLIIGVDNIDTRAYTAEQVMKMMAAKSGFERKITVLHFED